MKRTFRASGRSLLRQRSAGNSATVVLGVLGLVALVAVVWAVLSIGRRAQARELAQMSADSSALNGAAALARSLNTICVNNAALARQLIRLQLLDALPSASAAAESETQAAITGLERLLAQGLPSPWKDLSLAPQRRYEQLESQLQAALETLRDMNQTAAELRQRMTRLEQAGPIAELTHYRTPSGRRGQIWRQMQALEDHNQALVANLTLLSQLSAIRGGALGEGRTLLHASALLLPPAPPLQVQRIALLDMQLALGNPNWYEPAAGPDPMPGTESWGRGYGPDPAVVHTRPRYDAGVPLETAHGHLALTPGVEKEAPRIPGKAKPAAEVVETPAPAPAPEPMYFWDNLADNGRHALRLRPLNAWIAEYCRKQWAARTSQTPQTIAMPNWVADPQQWRQQAGAPTQVMLLRLLLRSRWPMGHEQFLSANSWTVVDEDGRRDPRLVLTDDPQALKLRDPQTAAQVEGLTAVAPDWYLDHWTYTVSRDQSLGLQREVDEHKKAVPQTVHRYDLYAVVAVNFAQPRRVTTPFNAQPDDPMPAALQVALGAADPVGEGTTRRALVASLAQYRDPSLLLRTPLQARALELDAFAAAAVTGELLGPGGLGFWQANLVDADARRQALRTAARNGDPAAWALDPLQSQQQVQDALARLVGLTAAEAEGATP